MAKVADGPLPGPDGLWPADVLSKAQKMQSKTEEVRNTFNLPASECVIQDYYCSIEQSTINRGGRMYITPNYVCFWAGFPFPVTEHFPFRMISDIKQNIGKIFTNSIDIYLKDGKIVKFHSFMKVAETLEVLNHIWKFPPSYLRLESEEEEEDEIGVGGGGTFNPFGNGKKSLNVNVDGAKRAANLANEAKDKGLDILKELDTQGEQLDRIESTIDNVHANLDKGDRFIRGIGSTKGAAINLVTIDKTKHNNPKYIQREHLAHKQWMESYQTIQLEILLKLQNDQYVDSFFCFGKDKFFVKERASGKTIAQCIWEYPMVKYIVMRARPLHMDIRFKDNSPRFRLMTSNVQAITNELCIRCSMQENKPTVLFEPNARPFDYNSFYLTVEAVGPKDATGGSTKFVARKVVGTADLLSDQVDDETKKKVRKAVSFFTFLFFFFPFFSILPSPNCMNG